MLGTILIVVAVVAVLFVIVVALRPAEFRVARSALMSAPPAAVYGQVIDFHNWEAWSPWAKLDPACKNTFEGPAAGTGAVFGWAGNKNVGEGSMTITESRPNELIRIKLEFLKPFANTCNVEFTFKAEGNQTAVSWSMAGAEKNSFLVKAMGLFFNCEKMVGDQYEKGLAAMKSIVEAAPKQTAASFAPQSELAGKA